jgi:hypothetical protein
MVHHYDSMSFCYVFAGFACGVALTLPIISVADAILFCNLACKIETSQPSSLESSSGAGNHSANARAKPLARELFCR